MTEATRTVVELHDETGEFRFIPDIIGLLQIAEVFRVLTDGQIGEKVAEVTHHMPNNSTQKAILGCHKFVDGRRLSTPYSHKLEVLDKWQSVFVVTGLTGAMARAKKVPLEA